MNSYYNTNYNESEIIEVIKTIKEYIRENKYIVSINDKRTENREFITKYNLNSRKIKLIMLNIKKEDFCYTLQNKKERYKHETLYIFVPVVKLYKIDGYEELVKIYIKINIINECERIIIISFHKLNKRIRYLFK